METCMLDTLDTCMLDVTSLHLKTVALKAEKKCLNRFVFFRYQYDAKSGEWSKGRLKLDEWKMSEKIILYLRENFPHIQEKGVLASEIIKKAKQTPQITVTSGFVDRCKRAFGTGMRVAGKAIFALWCEETGIDINNNFDLFLKQKSLVVDKLYDQLSTACRWLGRKRINGSVKRNVFVFCEEPLTPVVSAVRCSDPTVCLQDLTTASLVLPDR